MCRCPIIILYPVSPQEADLVTTHELGHNFGAEHDPDNIPYCAPTDDQGGKFVMYPFAVSGDHVNNKVKKVVLKKTSTSGFSVPCSFIICSAGGAIDIF